MKVKSIIFSTLLTVVALSSTAFASVSVPTPVPEADPTLLIAVGVAAIGYVAAVTKHRSKK